MQFTFDPSVAYDRLLHVHLDYLRRADPNFKRWWNNLPPGLQEDRRLRLGEMSRLALQLPSEFDGSYSIGFKRFVDAVLQRGVALPDEYFDIQIQVEPSEWIEFVRTRSQNKEVYRQAVSRLTRWHLERASS